MASSSPLEKPAIKIETMSALATDAPFADATIQRCCPACGGNGFADRRVDDFLHTHTCRSCGLILSSMTRRKPKLGQYANVDLRAYLTSVGALRHEQSSTILAFLAPYVSPGARVLDVGCGFGSFLLRAREAGYAVAGIEPDEHACASACEALGSDVVKRGTLLQAKPPAHSADVIATLDVLEHVPPAEHAAYARTMADVLAPGGIWAIKVPSTEGLYYRLSAALARVAPRVGATFMRRLWQTDYEFPHTAYFDRRSLQCWLQRHGFTIVDSRYLPEVPIRTIIDRLTHDGDISRAQAYCLAPVVFAINVIEWLRRRSDALVVLARCR
jgi:2-polyprenyl-3-methyl-5-hydroxy-6-metoxy-1,4-benzoquinol methylase